jgi:hypothetical protein
MNSENYRRQIEQTPPRFDIAELLRRYEAGEPLDWREKRDAAEIIRASAAFKSSKCSAPEHLEIPAEPVATVVHLAAEAVAVILFFAAAVVWSGILSGRI